MRVFDASSMIYAWDNYPVGQFPGLWEWMAGQIEEKQLVMPSVAFDEVNHKTPDCGEWLKENNLEQLAISNAILQEAKRIKGLLGIANDKYTTGVGENDILIIAAARLHGAELVSDEAKQPNLPKIPSNRKIPAVCVMPTVSVTCINFIEYIKHSEEVFR
ncbi:MAG: DNA-binding protein [Gallionellales bacterium RIFCSPLOWO2_12_FULL_59_22]|nr:MAG: DNA-binding protein [Gallionellales bacterium RIFCSPLOWO2_02_58_13]OGT12488.1 MAG: DNA-binding protein [Gallionellales bacterium RIFCSPLOWO2_12_FULL_59_22]